MSEFEDDAGAELAAQRAGSSLRASIPGAYAGRLEADSDLPESGLEVRTLLNDHGSPKARTTAAFVVRFSWGWLLGVASVVWDHGDRRGGVVKHGMSDGPDVGAERRTARAAADDEQGRVAGGVDQVVGGLAGSGPLNDLDGRELLPPGAQRLGQGVRPLGVQFGVQPGVGGESVREVGADSSRG